jgi:hypothetical protein
MTFANEADLTAQNIAVLRVSGPPLTDSRSIG